jgi:aspartyl-tRNA(Asn)/glutamyl-tRNA(Gln) amidotransferase subunit C
MTQLTTDDVAHVSLLANLPLTPDEIEKFKDQLSPVVSYIDELSEVDTDGVEPTSQTTGLENVMREDEIQAERILSQEEALSGTEKTHNGYFVVDMVLGEKRES